MEQVKTLESLQISVRGVVQGVGFRPFIYQLATGHDLRAWVCHTSGDVKIEVEGERENLERFLTELRTNAPPMARLDSIHVNECPPTGYELFEIRQSIAQSGEYQLVSPDIATCDACKKELLDPSDRRYRYPFTNCTNCGPRFTIIQDIPYDRPNTTMHQFRMCSECQVEYDDPLNRRFHAQPNACSECGPRLELLDSRGRCIQCRDELDAASRFLRDGKVVAIKGLGGFLLACDATSDVAVELLRERKKRVSKPFAVMAASLDEIKEYCEVSPEEEKLLASPQCPIVLLRWKAHTPISQAVAPRLRYLGVMLPYTPLHHVLLRETALPLVMTSGNLSEEPIATDNDEAIRRLAGLADYFLLHNRGICSGYDDTVAVVEQGVQLMRRARGYAPYPIHLPFEARQVLACGAEMRNTFCLTRESHAFVSQHIGDMENLETLEHFENTVGLYERLFRIHPELIACDMHPDYLSTRWAQRVAGERGIPLLDVQHHHAHIAGCLAENGIQGPIIGIALDGTGYGTDGRIWGEEFLVTDYQGFQRKGHLEYLPLPGGDAAVERPYRTAIGYLYALLGEDGLKPLLPVLRDVGEMEISTIKKQMERGVNSPLTSSCGRLFDAVSAMLGICGKISYEGQAAVELEMAAYDGDAEGAYPFAITEQGGTRIVMLRELFEATISDMSRGFSKGYISARFHNTMSRITTQMCLLITAETDITRVALSGGVFQNRLLLRKTAAALQEAGFTVYTHSQVPCNDGGISLGQAVIANFATL